MGKYTATLFAAIILAVIGFASHAAACEPTHSYTFATTATAAVVAGVDFEDNEDFELDNPEYCEGESVADGTVWVCTVPMSLTGQ
jgi:hypothetical protein